MSSDEYRDEIREMTVAELRGEETLLIVALSYRMEARAGEPLTGRRLAHRRACITAGRLADVRFELELRGCEPQLFGCERGGTVEEGRVLVAA